MKIKLVCFDLDGTLTPSTKNLHYTALTKALWDIAPDFQIYKEDHDKNFEALSTKQKIKILNSRGLPEVLNKQIEERKQFYTFQILENHDFNLNYDFLISSLKEEGLLVALCTNSIRRTTEIIISKILKKEKFDFVLTNEDVEFPKPNPEMYIKAMNLSKCLPLETLIFEDSENGLAAAKDSGAGYVKVSSPEEMRKDYIFSTINIFNKFLNILR